MKKKWIEIKIIIFIFMMLLNSLCFVLGVQKYSVGPAHLTINRPFICLSVLGTVTDPSIGTQKN